jgi:hypothetical protein
MCGIQFFFSVMRMGLKIGLQMPTNLKACISASLDSMVGRGGLEPPTKGL